jgi:predicted Fe-Mo cluster-binding NifX family protein
MLSILSETCGCLPYLLADVIGLCQHLAIIFKSDGWCGMKLAFTTSGDSLASALDPSFGRAANFLVYDLLTKTCTAIGNRQNLAAAQGAGIQAAQTVVNAGVQGVVTGHCGPKAFRVLASAGVKVFLCDSALVADALARYQAGALSEAEAANIEGHWV